MDLMKRKTKSILEEGLRPMNISMSAITMEGFALEREYVDSHYISP